MGGSSGFKSGFAGWIARGDPEIWICDSRIFSVNIWEGCPTVRESRKSCADVKAVAIPPACARR
jgi:hypothetical protein